MSLPTGDQHHLHAEGPNGPVTATVVELAAGIRALSVGGVELVQDYAADSLPSWGSGIVLVPWPNRVAGARWTDDDGTAQQLDITEPSRGNAIHGLLRNTGYRVTDRANDAITLTAPVFPQHGYPFHLDTSVRYELGADGITVTHGVRNAGDRPAPVGIGAHPFLRIGDTPMRDLTVTVRAGTWFEVDERMIPVAEHPVAGTEYDLSRGRPLADATLDTAFGDVELQDDGRARHRLTAPNGAGVELWGSEDFRFTQVFTTGRYVSPSGVIDAVAIEPMTCPPDALNSRQGLRMLAPDEQWVTSWGIRYLPA
jgi:aldose 1-epimerase